MEEEALSGARVVMLRRIGGLLLLALVLVPGTVALAAEQIWINDIQVNPSRYWNTTVTVIGQVMATASNPPGTTRGTYTLLDDSSPIPLNVRTKDLPPVGKIYSVTGVFIQDPAQANAPLIRELKRGAPGMSTLLRYALIGGSALFLVLLVVFFSMLVKPRRRPVPRVVTIAPAARGTPVSGSLPLARPVTQTPTARPVHTSKLPQAEPVATPTPDKTQVFMSLGAELIVDRGPDEDRQFPLHKEITTVGRPGSRKNDIELTDDTVSKEQASVFFDATTKRFTLSNQSRTNPTMVNQVVATEGRELEDGDLIEMGRTTIRFERS